MVPYSIPGPTVYRGYYRLTPILLPADAQLTPLGEAQAKAVNELWKEELARPDDPIPIVSALSYLN